MRWGQSDCDAKGAESHDVNVRRHSVTIQPFEIGKYEVTFDEYSAFVLDTDGVELPHDERWGRGSRPVINVSWDDAKAYAEWLSRVTGKPFRLPTEAEWEYAARAGTTTNYWWGDEVNQDGKVWANCYGCGSEWDGKRTAPVGSFPANGFGLHDMHGNVWEWTEDDWHDNYNGAPDDGRSWTDDPRGSYRVIRGGGWYLGARYCRSAFRSRRRARLPLRLRWLSPLQVRCPWPLSPWTLGNVFYHAPDGAPHLTRRPPKRSRRHAG